MKYTNERESRPPPPLPHPPSFPLSGISRLCHRQPHPTCPHTAASPPLSVCKTPSGRFTNCSGDCNASFLRLPMSLASSSAAAVYPSCGAPFCRRWGCWRARRARRSPICVPRTCCLSCTRSSAMPTRASARWPLRCLVRLRLHPSPPPLPRRSRAPPRAGHRSRFGQAWMDVGRVFSIEIAPVESGHT